MQSGLGAFLLELRCIVKICASFHNYLISVILNANYHKLFSVKNKILFLNLLLKRVVSLELKIYLRNEW